MNFLFDFWIIRRRFVCHQNKLWSLGRLPPSHSYILLITSNAIAYSYLNCKYLGSHVMPGYCHSTLLLVHNFSMRYILSSNDWPWNVDAIHEVWFFSISVARPRYKFWESWRTSKSVIAIGHFFAGREKKMEKWPLFSERHRIRSCLHFPIVCVLPTVFQSWPLVHAWQHQWMLKSFIRLSLPAFSRFVAFVFFFVDRSLPKTKMLVVWTVRIFATDEYFW